MTSLIEDMCLFIFLALGIFQLTLENNLSSFLNIQEDKRFRQLCGEKKLLENIILIVCYCYDINEPILLIRKSKNKKLTHCVNATKI
jgi:hypothetical protein